MRDVIMSDHFKTLREPLIEQQKKTDAKQDKVIEQLKENQLALTSAIQGIMALPQKTEEGRKDLIANIENRFDAEDRQILDKLIQPATLFQANVDDLTKYQEDVKEKIKQNVHTIIGLKNTKKKDVIQELEEKKRKRKTIDNIITLKTYYLKPKTGKGGKYKQPKRNAYKIQDGNFGGLHDRSSKTFQ